MQIGHVIPRTSPAPSQVARLLTSALRGAPSAASSPSSPSSADVCISPAGRALGSFRAAISDAAKALDNVPPCDLRDLVKRAQRDVSLGDWANDARELADEVPKGADKARMDIAQRAASFVGKQASPPRPPGLAHDNPFYGMSRADLAAIEYDESGRFTINERRAAASEAGRQYGEWSAEVCARAAEERARTGKQTNFLREVLAYFEALPAVEQANTPDGYIGRLRADVAASEKPDTDAWGDNVRMLMPSSWHR